MHETRRTEWNTQRGIYPRGSYESVGTPARDLQMPPSTRQSESNRLGESRSGASSLSAALASVSAGVARPLRAAGFYSAIGLPFVYLPLLADGVGPTDAPVVGVLLAANALALVVGHGYGSR